MKKNKIITIASAICISLSGLVACSSNNNPEVNVDESNLSEEAKIYNEAVELYQSGNEKSKNAEYETALNDYLKAIELVDKLIQINEIEEYTTFKEELNIAIENTNSMLENTEEDTSNVENTEEDTSNTENTEEDTSNTENTEEDTSNVENAE